MSAGRRVNFRLRKLATAGTFVLALIGSALVAPIATAQPAQAADGVIRANEEIAFHYFVGKGLTPVQAAGVVGNLDQESYMDPTIHQIGGGPGRGLAQWSAGGRWDTYPGDNLVEFADNAGVDRYDLQIQLDFVWYELSQFSYYGLAQLQAATTIDAAVIAFQDKYEGCGTCHTDRRIAYAQDAYNRYA
ncbi:MAG TPA: phage tail tip lysozyme [Microlunatus sp.]|nr:phage tail tip lysozyme [Microlunatus sp.]